MKAAAIIFMILLSLMPAYLLYNYLQKAMRPRESMQRFLGWMLTVFLLVFLYTFLVVFVIKMIFQGP
jgi:uncharacterized membrane protein YidH (DUF202 family)